MNATSVKRAVVMHELPSRHSLLVMKRGGHYISKGKVAARVKTYYVAVLLAAWHRREMRHLHDFFCNFGDTFGASAAAAAIVIKAWAFREARAAREATTFCCRAVLIVAGPANSRRRASPDIFHLLA